jgi:hypothetical protein
MIKSNNLKFAEYWTFLFMINVDVFIMPPEEPYQTDFRTIDVFRPKP